LKENFFDDTFESNVCMNGLKSEPHEYGVSQLNYGSVSVVLHMVELLIFSGFEPQEIGIMVPYKAQCGLIEEQLVKFQYRLQSSVNFWVRAHVHDLHKILINTIDAMQGQERDIIIFDLVTAKHQSFLGYPRRLALGCTRAKIGLIMICNADTLWKNAHHYESDGMNAIPELIRYCKSHKLYREAKQRWLTPIEK
jgi:superfamily I DNA and/or RNA helicase